MNTSIDTEAGARSDIRAARLRVFGGTALAFVALLIVAALVRPDLMQDAVGMVMGMVR